MRAGLASNIGKDIMAFVSRRFKCSTFAHSRKIFACAGIIWILFFNLDLSGRTNLSPPDFSSGSWRTGSGLPQNSAASISGDDATLALTVAPWFLQTWWFVSGGVLAGIAAVGVVALYITRRRLRRKMEHLKRQRALEKERARIARDIHDDLGAGLTRIMLLSQSGCAELEDSHQAVTHLEKIYSTARELTSAMGEIVWAVSPHHDTLDSLVSYLGKYAQDFLSAANIRCRLDLPIQLPAWPLTAEVRHNLFLAFKEALNNVTKHGAAAEVRISLEFTRSGFSLLIEDDGRGFDPGNAGAVASTNNSHHIILTGNGLANMRKRISVIGGKFQIDSRPGGGTRVKFVVGHNGNSADLW